MKKKDNNLLDILSTTNIEWDMYKYFLEQNLFIDIPKQWRKKVYFFYCECLNYAGSHVEFGVYYFRHSILEVAHKLILGRYMLKNDRHITPLMLEAMMNHYSTLMVFTELQNKEYHINKFIKENFIKYNSNRVISEKLK
jgi:hypothetical protein